MLGVNAYAEVQENYLNISLGSMDGISKRKESSQAGQLK
jgi:hypothetical protein